MRVLCNATVLDDQQKSNLCECLRVLQADYYTKGYKVFAEFEGSREKGELLVGLFQHFPFHGISVLT